MDSRPDLVRAMYPLVDDVTGAALQTVRDKSTNGACRAELVPGHNEMLIYLAASGLIEAREVSATRRLKARPWQPDCIKLVSGDVRKFEVHLSEVGLAELGRWEVAMLLDRGKDPTRLAGETRMTMLNEKEAQALRTIGEREWRVSELPGGIDANTLDALDRLGLVEVRTHTNRDLPSDYPGPWHSHAMGKDTWRIGRGWKQVMEYGESYDVRLSKEGFRLFRQGDDRKPAAIAEAAPAGIVGHDDEDRHPSLLLFDALNFLHGTCSSADSFQELGRQRKAAREFRSGLAQAIGEAAAERANQRIRNGEHPFDVLGEFADADKFAIMPPQSAPAEYFEGLRDVLARGLSLCRKGREALREGGAGCLDVHVAASRSIDITKKVMEAETTFLKLDLGLRDPSILIDDDAAAMAALADYFENQRIELSAVLEMRGMPTGATDVDEVRDPNPAGPAAMVPAQLPQPGPWRGDPWKDPGRPVDERVRFYMVKLSASGKTERPTCRDVADAIGASPGAVAGSKAWKAWEGVEKRGIVADRADPSQHVQSKRIEAQRIRQDGDDED